MKTDIVLMSDKYKFHWSPEPDGLEVPRASITKVRAPDEASFWETPMSWSKAEEEYQWHPQPTFLRAAL